MVVGVKPVDTSQDEVKNAAIKSGGLTKKLIIESVIAVEKGYVNNKDDRGGETNFGITKAVADENAVWLKSQFKWDGTMRNLSYDMAYAIYEKKYWTPLRLDDIAKRHIFLADKLFDISVNCGTGKAGIWLKTLLNVFNYKGTYYKDIDATTGFVGDLTIQSLDALIAKRGNTATVKTLLGGLVSQQGAHYVSISVSREDNETFTWGWMSDRLYHHLGLYFSSLK